MRRRAALGKPGRQAAVIKTVRYDRKVEEWNKKIHLNKWKTFIHGKFGKANNSERNYCKVKWLLGTTI